ncbi:hypothetical protein SVIOM74S_04510 [Streptomyces violarus]
MAAKGKWRKYTATLSATRTSNRGRLTVATTARAALDTASLFPRETYRNQPGGLRKDLAEKIEALRPGFLRFPGGCLVNTGSMADYSADSGWQRKRSYQWIEAVRVTRRGGGVFSPPPPLPVPSPGAPPLRPRQGAAPPGPPSA